MNLFERLKQYFETKIKLENLLKILLIAILILIIQAVLSKYNKVFDKIWGVLIPFIIGDVIAIVMEPLFAKLKKKGIPRWISITCFWVLIGLVITVLFYNLIPSLSTKIVQLVKNITQGISSLGSNISDNSYLNDIFKNISSSLITGLNKLLPTLTNSIPNLISDVVSWLGNLVIIVVISIYMMADYTKIHDAFSKLLGKIKPSLPVYVSSSREEVATYFRSMFILMAIRYVEYLLVYLLIGNSEWSTLAFLTAISVIVPYVGPILSNVVGVIASLTLPTSRIVILLVLILILSNVDNYLISPMVHSRRSYINPLVTLFVVFLGSALAGVYGVIFAVPFYLILRNVFQTYGLRHPKLGTNVNDDDHAV